MRCVSFLWCAAKTDVTLLIKFNGKHGAVCANRRLNAAHHLWYVYLFMSFWAKICTSHCYSVLVFWFVQIVGKKSRIKAEKEQNERPCCCFYGKIKWNIKHIVLDDTNWTWLNEKPHYINYVRDFFWSTAEAQRERKGDRIRYWYGVQCVALGSAHNRWSIFYLG